MENYAHTHEELRQFIMVKNGFTGQKMASPQKKLYTLFYKNNKVVGFIDKPYPLIKWKRNDMVQKGEANKAFLEIRPTKAFKKF